MTGKNPKATQFSLVLTSLLIVSLLLAACGGVAAGPAATGSEAASADSSSGSTAAISAGGLQEVPRNRTHIFMGGGREGQFVDHELWNPYAIGANHQVGPNIIYEPLAFYSAFADEELLWLAESYEYNEDFTELTLTLRDGGSVVLGGLISRTSSEGQQGVPWLGRIPILGHLFRTQSDSSSTTELMVMVIPYVIRNDSEAQNVSAQLRERIRLIGAQIEQNRAVEEFNAKSQGAPLPPPVPNAPPTASHQPDSPTGGQGSEMRASSAGRSGIPR